MIVSAQTGYHLHRPRLGQAQRAIDCAPRSILGHIRIGLASVPFHGDAITLCRSHAQLEPAHSEASLLSVETGVRDRKRGLVHLLQCCAIIAAVGFAMPQLAQAATAQAGTSPIAGFIHAMLHLDHHLSALIAQHGSATYAILWAIVFCETGLVLTPFLPGDSLLFAAGAFAGLGQLSLPILFAVFLSSAVLGDAVNYAVGNRLGGWALTKNILRQEYIDKTEKFYAKYGAKTVVLARFVPIVRTFAPFVAGIGSMPYSVFAFYNVAGAVLWTTVFLACGFFVGNVPFVQKNFTAVVLGIVAISVVPVVVELWQARREARENQEGAPKSA